MFDIEPTGFMIFGLQPGNAYDTQVWRFSMEALPERAFTGVTDAIL